MDKSNVFSVTVVVSLDEHIGKLPFVDIIVKKGELFAPVLAECDALWRESDGRSGVGL